MVVPIMFTQVTYSFVWSYRIHIGECLTRICSALISLYYQLLDEKFDKSSGLIQNNLYSRTLAIEMCPGDTAIYSQD